MNRFSAPKPASEAFTASFSPRYCGFLSIARNLTPKCESSIEHESSIEYQASMCRRLRQQVEHRHATRNQTHTKKRPTIELLAV